MRESPVARALFQRLKRDLISDSLTALEEELLVCGLAPALPLPSLFFPLRRRPAKAVTDSSVEDTTPKGVLERRYLLTETVVNAFAA